MLEMLTGATIAIFGVLVGAGITAVSTSKKSDKEEV